MDTLAEFLPPQSMWPPFMRNVLRSRAHLHRKLRYHAVVFLYGNGVRPGLIWDVVVPRLRTNDGRVAKRRRDVMDLLTKLHAGRMSTHYYFDLATQDYYYLNGEGPVAEKRPPQPFVRVLNAWDRNVWHTRVRTGAYPTVREQDAFVRG